MIAIIDYKMGNVGSIKNMLSHIGVESIITSNIDEINNANKIILPGVGKFDYGMNQLNDLGLTELLRFKAREKKTPMLGICLGMQLFTLGSEEGREEGIGIVQANTKRFSFTSDLNLKVPHMGWNLVNQAKNSRLLKGFDQFDESRFYFVHSYYVECLQAEDVLLKTFYGFEFCSAFQKDNVFGCQFHPEKSHKFGMKLLKNFAEVEC